MEPRFFNFRSNSPRVVVVAVERRPSPSDTPQRDWLCVVFGSGFTTQQRLRSPPPGMLGPRPSLLLKAAKTPSPRRLCRMAAIKPDLHASESPEGRSLRMQGCGKDWQPFNDDIATWQRPTRGDLTCPRPSQPRVVRRRGLPPQGDCAGALAPPPHVLGA